MRLHRLLIPLTAFLAVFPMLVHGPSCGHDFDFHLLSWLEASTQLAHGGVPHWAFTPAWNAGEPRFLFYPPLSWLLGALLGLILPWLYVPAAFTFLALTLAGFTLHHAVRRYVSAPAATVAALVYLTNPYMLFTAYERTAYAELLAAAWLPLLIAAALDPTPLPPRKPILSIAIPLALLWLTNAPAAILGTYALAVLTLLRLPQPGWPMITQGRSPRVIVDAISTHPPSPQTRLQLTLTTLAATALGLLLAAVYLVPAIVQRRYIQLDSALTEGMRPADHVLFHHMPPAFPDAAFHDQVVHTASLIALALLISIGLLLLTNVLTKPTDGCPIFDSLIVDGGHRLRHRGPRRALFARWGGKQTTASSLFPLAILTAIIAVLLTPASLPIWRHAPELAFLQFPWRLNSLLAVILALLAAQALNHLASSRGNDQKPTPYAFLLIPAAVLLTAWPNFHQPCDPDDAVPARASLFHSNLGTEATDEYTPKNADPNADPDALHRSNPPFWLIAPNQSVDTAPPLNTPPGQAPSHLTLTLTTPAILVLNRRQYPLWQLSLDHTPVPPHQPEREDGLLTLALPSGQSTIDLTERRTPDESAGLALTLLALLLATSLLKRPRGAP